MCSEKGKLADKPFEIIVLKKAPSNNTIKKMHHQKYKKLRDEWSWLIRAAIKKIPKKPIGACVIMVESRLIQLMDWDNCYGGLKPILDCLVVPTKTSPSGLGIIIDDNPTIVRHLSAVQTKVSTKKEEGITISIYEVLND